jgi:hypothetical protein
MQLLKRSGPWWATLTGTVIWGLAIAAGFLALHRYESTPGPAGAMLGHWPGPGRVPLQGDRHTLIMAVHPRCPCTRASLAELARILTRCAGLVEVYVLIFIPESGGQGWGPTDSLRRLGTLAGVHLIEDVGGVEAARFGARTSGHVALYAPDGRLLFRGGITSVRDHEGDNAGRQAILSLVCGQPAASPAATPVFGCPIFDPPSPRGSGTP